VAPTVRLVKVTTERRQTDAGSKRRIPLGPVALGVTALIAVTVVASSGFESVNEQPALDSDPILSEQLAGVDAAVQMIVERGADTYHLAWEPDRPLATETRLDIREGRLNADGSLIGGLGRTIADLWVGTVDTITPVNADTLSFAWHQSDPNKLASIRLLGGQHQLWLGERRDDGTHVFSSFAPIAEGLTIAAYGDWGVAVHNEVPSAGVFFIQVFGSDATVTQRRSGRVIGSWPGVDGGVIVDEGDGQTVLVSAQTTTPIDLANSPITGSMTWDSSRQMAAGSAGDGRTVVTLEGAVVAEAIGRPLRWVSPSVILLAAQDSLGYLDVTDGSVGAASVNGTIVDAALGG